MRYNFGAVGTIRSGSIVYAVLFICYVIYSKKLITWVTQCLDIGHCVYKMRVQEWAEFTGSGAKVSTNIYSKDVCPCRINNFDTYQVLDSAKKNKETRVTFMKIREMLSYIFHKNFTFSIPRNLLVRFIFTRI